MASPDVIQEAIENAVEDLRREQRDPKPTIVFWGTVALVALAMLLPLTVYFALLVRLFGWIT